MIHGSTGKLNVAIATLSLALTTTAFAAGPPTALTYQGQLSDGGVPVDGSVDLQFRMFNAATGGQRIGAIVTANDVPVVNGVFTIDVDFGTTPYTENAARWLEINVDGIWLEPRQRLTGAPFALNTRGLNVDSAGNVGIGTTSPQSRFDVNGDVKVVGELQLDGHISLDAAPTRIDFQTFLSQIGVPGLVLNNTASGSTAMSFRNSQLEWLIGQNQSPAGTGFGDYFVFEGGANENRILIEQGGSATEIQLNGNVVVSRDLEINGDLHVDGIQVTPQNQVLIGTPTTIPGANNGRLYVYGGDIVLDEPASSLRFGSSAGDTRSGIYGTDDDDLELWADGRQRVTIYEENGKSVL
ncbi:MAG: hypothetical protein AB7N71_09100, partial [Phycisphaerae bacterium]